MKLAVAGATGRMGQSIVRLAAQEGFSIVGAIASPQSPHLGRDVGDVAGAGTLGVAISDDVSAGLLGADVVIDFSRPEALNRVLTAARRQKIAVVSGTTRLDVDTEKKLDEASATIPVLWAPNTSLGVQVLAEIVAEAARRLGPGFDVEIVETHHKAKVDSPSGTATRLADAVRDARKGLRTVTGREGNVGPRAADEIGVFAMRGGDVIGDHTVHLLGPGERLELTHRATNRDLFARGALRAARYLFGKPAGRYSMADVLG
ncbi:4-hydroxy-tetrahydrodipicolinate reductase [Polyangium sp. 15x6]|nr:4-hydroxy-tetrahydrodipicolinate reductase [Polyangium sp. 15x6]MDI3285992.1 4-hydroxy-tetrahydrodipicolinate reductase [Polyangium sp. 15x6]